MHMALGAISDRAPTKMLDRRALASASAANGGSTLSSMFICPD